MFNEKEYQEMFAHVTASEQTRRRILSMTKDNKKTGRHSGRLASQIAIAAVLVSMLTLTASAAARNWFVGFFSESADATLTTEQMEFLESNTQTVEQSQTHDGYTLRVRSMLTDGERAYIAVSVTAPEDVVLSETTMEGYDPAAPYLTFENLDVQSQDDLLCSFAASTREDNDGKKNTQDCVIEVKARQEENGGVEPFGAGRKWTLRFENLGAMYYNRGYYEELMQSKYKNQKDVSLSVEEIEKIHPEVTLAKGTWEFEIQFSEADLRRVELVEAPMAVKVIKGWKENGEEVYETCNMTSFVLTALSATMKVDQKGYAPDVSGQVFAVMKDGSKVELLVDSGEPGMLHFRTQAPITLEQVNSVQWEDGTVLSMPE